VVSDVNRLAPALILLIVLFSASVFLPKTGTVRAYEGIYIRADGSVEGTDEIQRVGDVYSFTANIEGSIFVDRDNIVLDGAGYKLQSSGDSVGIDLRGRNNVTVRNLKIEDFLGNCGILLIDTINCNIIRNNLTDNFKGIEMTGSSSRNRIAENHVQNNQAGIEIYSVNPGSDNVISENEVANNHFGIQIKDFFNTNISGNIITSNTWGLGLGVGSGSVARNNIMNDNTYGFRSFNIQAVNVDVDTSNTVNGKPIYYWVDQHNKTVPADACYVALIGCTNITVKNLNLAGNLEGVFLGSTTNSTIASNRITDNMNGITFDASSNNTVTENLITNNEAGISVRWNSLNNTIIGNDITSNNSTGIYIAESESNSIIGNNVTNSGRGVYTEYCGVNIFHHNNFINNTQQWDDIAFTPWPIPLQFSVSTWDDGKEGNYWSDYENKYPNATELDSSGIWNIPYVLDESNQDNYPLMKPYIIPEFPSWTTILLTLTAFAVILALYKKKITSKNTST
jgi:parallel beta-helix repeat protein